MRRSVRLPGGCAIVEQGCFCDCGNIFAEIFGTGKIALITDENVARLYGSAAKSALQSAGFIACDYVVPAGEQSKNLSEYAKILSFLARSGFTGGDTVLSFGGGVVSDLGGFAAATYHRGIRHAIIPTTVLSAIDAAIGGKTAVDLPEGKNLAGCFFQPEAVVCDPSLFVTLGKEELAEGMGELCKYSLLTGEKFDVKHADDPSIMSDIVVKCIKYKAKIVKKDRFDKGIRRYLNLGHTIAHAVESSLDYAVPHGIAVFYGLRRVIDACFKHGIMSEKHYGECLSVLADYDVPQPKIDCAALGGYMCADKKRSGNIITLALLRAPGKPFLRDFDMREACEFLCS